MSCSTLNAGSIRMEVAMASLPEGFCPANLQDYANAIATRLIVTPNSNFTSFAAGSVAPTSNVGPWFMNCETWFIWDDNTASYVPMTKEGFNTQQYFTTSGNFVVPDFIYKLKITAIGGGGGGADSQGGSQGVGGGGGGFSVKIHNVDPGENIAIVIGNGGVNGAPGGVAGGNTTVTDSSGLVMTAFGGAPGLFVAGFNGNQALGGTASGGDINLVGGSGGSAYGSPGCGGDAAGWGGKGGTYGDIIPPRTGSAPGGGGSGGVAGIASIAGGSGANGAVLIEY